jgi:hypothetical protein
MMKTEDLVTRLASMAAPVRPVGRPWKGAALWFSVCVIYLGGVAAFALARRSRLAVTDAPLYVVQQLALLVTALTAAIAAFASTIPGYSRRILAAPAVPGAIALVSLITACVRDVQTRGTLGLSSQTDWPCVVSIFLGSAVLGSLLGFMLRRGAPLAPRLTGVLAAAAALGVTNIEACLTRPHLFNSVVLLWHGATSMIVVVVLAVAAGQVFRWPMQAYVD